ncbi:PAS domain S-box protein [Microcoleus sp. FACHB-1515]|uniref:PAS domain S-box protein n=1 Tax=Cyanophyceae TaxID=3028117 RepID=UPI001687ABC0|nr:PAS domain S-box protein [Microcoleus sp. FACHB-1515]MBD2092678.1 PAS domain S-box protein [Microcoleus sp. FACHB-1515]
MAASQPPQCLLLDCFQIIFRQIEQTLNQIEHSHQREEAKFRSLFEQSADALMLAENGVIFDCNQAAVELFGWQDKTEFLPLHAAELSPKYQPDGRASFEKAADMIALAQQNGNHRFEWMHQQRDGKDFWTEILLTQIELDGKPIQYTTVRDIRDRKQNEAKLREGERRFQAIFNQTFQLAGILSPDGVLLEANQTSLDVIAAQPEDVIGKLFWETPWWTHSPSVQQKLRQAIAQAKAGKATSFEYDAPTANGKMMALEFSIKPITNANGEVVMLIPEARDVSDRKHAEAERLQAETILREQEQFLRSIYDNVGNFIFVVDVLPDGNFHYVGWNAAGERGSGLSSEEISGKTPEEVFGKIEGAGDRQRLAQCVQQKCALTVEENLTFNGQSTWWITT